MHGFFYKFDIFTVDLLLMNLITFTRRLNYSYRPRGFTRPKSKVQITFHFWLTILITACR